MKMSGSPYVMKSQMLQSYFNLEYISYHFVTRLMALVSWQAIADHIYHASWMAREG